MLTRAALRNPYAVFAICMIALILGAVSYKKMRVDIFPEIKIPTILVTTFYRGMSPSEMEGAITLRMEQRFVEAVRELEGPAASGRCTLTALPPGRSSTLPKPAWPALRPRCAPLARRPARST